MKLLDIIKKSVTISFNIPNSLRYQNNSKAKIKIECAPFRVKPRVYHYYFYLYMLIEYITYKFMEIYIKILSVFYNETIF